MPGYPDPMLGLLEQLAQDVGKEWAHSESLNRVLLRLVGGLSTIGIDGCYEKINGAYAATCGYTPEEMVGMPWVATVHPDDRAAGLAAYEEMLHTGEASLLFRGVRKNGEVFRKRVVILTRFGADGEPDGHYCSMREVFGDERDYR